ncbi:MAG: EEP domain-containing protein [Gammaproteobacteria bacterium]|nr:EEP domain-containing protein [Gammaproteobacteria bacterium]
MNKALGTLANFASPRRVEPQWSAVTPLLNPRGIKTEFAQQDSLRLLSFNIQVGITTKRYRHYLTHGWKHLLPHVSRADNLRRIAELIGEYDVVALQEVDGGSLRSGFVNQVEYLAYRAHFPFWYAQLNRDLGPIAQHGNGLLSRLEPQRLEDHKLPGMIPGRGAIVMRVTFGDTEVLVVLLHLSLGERSRQRQLSYVRELISGHEHVVIMGDMNSHLSRLLFGSPLSDTALVPANETLPTYPSWRPSIALDHILVTPRLTVRQFEVLDCDVSDHRPLAVTIGLNQGGARLQ